MCLLPKYLLSLAQIHKLLRELHVVTVPTTRRTVHNCLAGALVKHGAHKFSMADHVFQILLFTLECFNTPIQIDIGASLHDHLFKNLLILFTCSRDRHEPLPGSILLFVRLCMGPSFIGHVYVNVASVNGVFVVPCTRQLACAQSFNDIANWFTLE